MKTAGRESFRDSGNTICSEPDGEGGDEAAKDEGHDGYDKENQVKGQNGRVSELLATKCLKSTAPPGMGRHDIAMVHLAV